MEFSKKIAEVQKYLEQSQLSGWLIYDFHGTNRLGTSFFSLPEDQIITRRLFYWIPAVGEPQKLVHAIEAHVLDHLPGGKHIYLKWQTLELLLSQMLKGAQKVAMEYSFKNHLPYVSKVDGGIIDLVRSFGIQVESSASFLQHFTCILDEAQKESLFFAANVLTQTIAKAWDWIASALKRHQPLTEYEVQQWVLEEIHKAGCETGGDSPICAAGKHSALPHYSPTRSQSAKIKEGDLVLIDLSCKQKKPRAIFADMTYVAVASESPTQKQQEIFRIVQESQAQATQFVLERHKSGATTRGSAVDDIARKVIVEAGYGDFFTHRTGHNIYTELHGPGAHLDNLETCDERYLLPNTCFSIEPGIYLPEEFGIRLEYDLLLEEKGKGQIIGIAQKELVSLL